MPPKKTIEIANVSLREDDEQTSSYVQYYDTEALIDQLGQLDEKYFYSNTDEKDQAAILKRINKKYQDFIDQYSINTLFLSIGLLKWYDGETEDKYYSPLMFVQTNLSIKSNAKSKGIFSLSFDEESQLVPNYSLLKKLNYSFGIKIDLQELEKCETNHEKYELLKEMLTNNFHDERWGFLDLVYLDTFSFSKINMYADLEQNENKIVENEFIKSVSNEETNATTELDLINEANVESKIDIANYYHILDSDSSQEVAIQSAIKGKSFILQGPPGTGKSHTITNIITELLARNKKILFVAEKKAALDVVYNNLNKIGLGDYSIPIHSIDLDKKIILKNLADSLEKAEKQIVIDQNISNNMVRDYQKTVSFLSDYGAQLLKIRKPLNISLYKLIGLYYSIKNTEDLLFSIPEINSIDEEKINDLRVLINELENYCAYFNFSVQTSSWWGSKWTRITEEEKERLFNNINSLSQNIDNLYQNLLQSHKSLTVNDQRFCQNILYLKDIFEKTINIDKFNQKIFDISDYSEEIDKYSLAIEKNNRLEQLKTKLNSIFKLEIVKEDLVKFRDYFLLKSKSAFRFFSPKWTYVKKIIKNYSLTNDKAVIEANLNDLLIFKQLKGELLELKNSMIIKPIDSSVEILFKNKEMIELANIIDVNSNRGDFNLDKVEYFKTYNSDIRYKNDIQNTLAAIDKFLNNFNQIYTNFNDKIIDLTQLSIPQLKEMMHKLNNEKHDLNTVVIINRTISDLDKLGLSDFADKILNSSAKHKFMDIFLKRFYKLLVDKIIHDHFAQFNDSNLETFRDMFLNVEQNVRKLARVKVEANLLNNIPTSTGLGSQNIEVKILKSEANKSRKIMPFKKLFEKIPNLLLQLKPCLMMSPLSVSAYLKDSDIVFDTVIFDEASQVKPETAIGAIYRAKQVIIVGDSEQLPPTNFFNTIEQDSEVEDLEQNAVSIKGFDSILDMANISLDTIKLRWHYRSLFEELIYPSNREIYNNLITFPSKLKPKKFEGINKIYVKGYFLDRRNEVEADKVIELVKNIILQYGIEASVGVVCFNQEQQLLIERKIEKFKHDQPRFSAFFDRDKVDNFFVKNIETVQGDEREFIIISSVYGPDSTGKISMRFGPINNENGYKRLNVAFTRAKRGLLLVTSLNSEDIDLNRSNSRGVRFLKTYLQTAEFSVNKLVDNLKHDGDFDSLFEHEVYGELIKLGYDVKTQVGSSGYRIDLAVVDPQNPNNYILGIECDGATYHSSKTARDRDRLRQEVLEKRGWKIHRIWSTDWFSNKANQLNKLKSIIENIKSPIKSIQNNEENQEELFKVVRKAETKIEFDSLPDFWDEFLIKSQISPSLGEQYAQSVLEKLIIKFQALHFTHLKKILNYLFDRETYSTIVQYHANKIFEELSYLDFKWDDDFLVAPNLEPKDFKFKINKKRTPETVYYYEYVDLITKIMNSVKIIDQLSLMRLIVSYLGYSSLNKKTMYYLIEIIEKMVDDKYLIFDEQESVYKSIN
ncbi:AAA domain-containing protein [Mycoplasma sp. HS2188]|uniref:AAA domain-containing protein n=1 Tax=Mycoplasma sp. HS2188 TaxID=2976765 RepID=UPI00288B5AAD|nr:AAA domain-containing protein [Mycoplasma sp. HS2188]